MYRGPLLEGLYVRQAPDFERWLSDERRVLKRLAVGAALQLASAASDQQKWEAARRWAERACSLAPYEEEAWRVLIRSLALSANSAGSLLAYERMVQSFKTDLGIDPSAETVVLVDSIRAGEYASRAGGYASSPGTDVGDRDRGVEPPRDRESEDGEGAEPLRGLKPAAASARRSSARQVVLFVGAALVGALCVVWILGTPRALDPSKVSSIAIRPLVDTSAIATDNYFADALTAEIGRELGKIDGLQVTSHGSAKLSSEFFHSVPEVARALGVEAVLEGRIQRLASSVSIDLRLLDATGEHELWSRDYDSRLGDLPILMSRIAADVEKALRGTAVFRQDQEEPKVKPLAYDAYLRGLHHLERYSTQEAVVAVGYLQRAIEIEPTFGAAHSALARACAWAWNAENRPMDFKQCETAAHRAISLDSTSADGHGALGFVLLRKLLNGLDPEWNWSAAEHEFRAAISLNQNLASTFEDYSELLRVQRRAAESRLALDRAALLDPLSLGVKLRVGIQHLLERRFDAALELWDEIESVDPTYATVHYARGATYIAMNQPEKILVEAQVLANRLGEDHLWVADLRAHAHALAGRRQEALALAQRPQVDRPDRLILFGVHYILGDTVAALDELENALDEQAGDIPNIMASSRYDGVREHPRFIAIRKSIGLD